MLKPVLVSPPSVLPVTLSDMKNHSRVEAGDEDDTIEAYLTAATAHLDGYSGILGRALISQQWRQDFPNFYGDKYPFWQKPILQPIKAPPGLRLALGDLLSVDSVTYYDTSNVQQTLNSSSYVAFSDEIGPYLTTQPGQQWPNTYGREDAVRVTFTCGYGTTADSVPAPIRTAIKMLVAQWYENRENVILPSTRATIQVLPFAVDALIAPYRAVGV